MATWQFTMEFIDRRVCTIESDTEEEAQEKMDSGDWAAKVGSERTTRGIAEKAPKQRPERHFRIAR